MSDLFDYLTWRGDILFSQLPVNKVDALILSTLSYIYFDGIVPESGDGGITLREAAVSFFQLENLNEKVRVKKDLELLEAAAETERFGTMVLSFYQNIFIPEEETQFAAMTCLLNDGSVFIVYRGTDRTLVGWKEDFNMSFQETIPAQRLALKYLQASAQMYTGTLRVGGHSKGGNLAVYAASKCDKDIQDRILEVYNQDGPGFRSHMMEDTGYLDMVPKIYTYVPQASIFGMIMKHKEPYIVIKSRSVGIMQHDPYNWEIVGKEFIYLDELTPESKFIDQTFDDWLAGMSVEERNVFIDMVFDLIMLSEPVRPIDVIKPQNVIKYLKTLHMDEERRKVIGNELARLIEVGKKNKSVSL